MDDRASRAHQAQPAADPPIDNLAERLSRAINRITEPATDSPAPEPPQTDAVSSRAEGVPDG